MARRGHKPPGQPRIAVCTFPGVLTVHGFVRSFLLTDGAEVDLAAVVDHDGDGQPVTLEAALGPHLAHFRPVDATAEPTPPAVDPADEG